MTLTLDLDQETGQALEKESRRSGEHLEAVASRALHAALVPSTTATKIAAEPRRFVVKPIPGMHLPAQWTSGSTQELIEIAEGPSTR